nr:MAG TPA: hypothetical protein [Caudoviricetes sp.]
MASIIITTPGRRNPVGAFPHVVLRKQEHFIKFF